MSNPDHYGELGVSETASEDEIKKAFRRFSVENHPDKNPGSVKAETKMKRGTEAYSILSDPERRRKYDRIRNLSSDGLRPGSGPQPYGWPQPYDGKYEKTVEDFTSQFYDIFTKYGAREAPKPRAPKKGQDIKTTLRISLEESLKGCKKRVNISSNNRPLQCDFCEGSGLDPDGKKIICKSCLGQGKFVSSRQHVMEVVGCETCKGLGKILISSCTPCNGSGKIRHTDIVKVTIPPGIEDGQKLRIQGKGGPGRGGGPGDLYIKIQVKPSADFKREGSDLHATFKVPLFVLLSGGKEKLKLPDGRIADIEIDPGTQPDHQIMMLEMGAIDPRNGSRGNLIVTVKVNIPVNPTPRARKLIEELSRELSRQSR